MTEQDRIMLQDAYRRVFGTPEGRIVLGHMLVELHFLDEVVDNSEEQGLANYARRLLKNCGIWNELNVNEIVNAFMDIHPKSKHPLNGTD